MLNTKSCTMAVLIWGAIVLFIGTALWDLLQWPAPAAALAMFLESDAAREIERFQTLLGTLLGLWGLAAAYWYTSAQSRSAMRDRGDRAVRTLASTIAVELGQLGSECDRVAAHIVRLVDSQERKPAGQAESATSLLARAGEDRVQLGQLIVAGLSTEHLVRLGRNGAAAVKMTRATIDALANVRRAKPADSAPFPLARQQLLTLARTYAEVGLRCERSQAILGTISRHGADLTDEGDLPQATTAADTERHLETVLARFASVTEMEPRSAAA